MPLRVAAAVALALATFGLVACHSTGTPPAQATAAPGLAGLRTSITYCETDGTRQGLDLYRPRSRPRRAMPVVVWVHGGGWVQGDSTISPGSLTAMIESALVTQGWTFASINYRLAPRYRWPAQIQDTKCAIRSLRQHAKALAINPRRIGAVGASAGGHLVSLLGLAGRDAGFDVGQYASQSSAVQAVVDMSGPEDLTSADWTTSPVALSSAAFTFGMPLGQPAPVLTKASPVTYIRRGSTPFLVLQGAQDAIVPPDQASELVQRLHDAGDVARLVMAEHADHELVSPDPGPGDPSPAQLAQYAVSFLERYLGRP